MQFDSNTEKFFQSKVLGHPAGLFVLFFTEMWERFSFYGMRVLLIQFLTMALIGTNPGWEWDAETAGSLFATYVGLLYLTPILGGYLADRFLGYRNSVALGALIMTSGHACMALDSEFTLYLGLGLLVIGTGFFKPTITSIISEMYKDLPQKKDGAYTIFYMGVNAGAFFGMMLCGYLAEKIGWSFGFGLAGIFMLLGLLQFWLAKPLFGKIGDRPEKDDKIKQAQIANDPIKRNPFTSADKILILVSAVIGLIFLLDAPFRINGSPLIPPFLSIKLGSVVLHEKLVFILVGLIVFFTLVIGRLRRYDIITRGRMIAVIIFAFFTVFFWMSFEQGASSLVLFARDYTDRMLEGSSATIFMIVDLLLTFGPLLIITWVLIRMWYETRKEILMSNIILIVCFLMIWGLGIWKTNRDMSTKSYEITFAGYKTDDKNADGSPVFLPITEGMSTEGLITTTRTGTLAELKELKAGDQIKVAYESDAFRLVDEEKENEIQEQLLKHSDKASVIIPAKVQKLEKKAIVEVTASWFSILNSFFIIVLGSLVGKIWESKYNPSAAVKYGLGLIIMAIGFGILAYGANGLVAGAGDASRVSLMWLVFAYFFHTIGELFVSPVGLSYVSKLVPGRMIAFMFGMWYLAIAIGQYSAAYLGGMIEEVQKNYSMSAFFLIFTAVPIAAGLIVIFLNPVIKKLMHGVK